MRNTKKVVKVKPMGPDEVKHILPDFVIQGVNQAITKYSFGKTSFVISQDDMIKEIMEFVPDGMTRNELFEKHYLDIEETYREAGWFVEFDKPGYNETYKPYFTFKGKK